MNANIHENLMDFLMKCPAFKRWHFGFSQAENASVAIVPIPSKRYIAEWAEGGGECQYQFAVAAFQNISHEAHVSGQQTESVEDMALVQSVMEWIEEQNDDGNLPVLGGSLIAQEIKVLQDVPSIAGENDRIQKTLFSASLIYLEIKEK